MAVASYRLLTSSVSAGWTPTASPTVTTDDDAGGELVAVVGCHGGAGTTTLARLLYPALDLSLVGDWPGFSRRWATYPTLLVARGTAAGTARAMETVAAAGTAGVRPAALVVVGDGPWPTPQAARARLRLMADRVGAVVLMPYVGRWRYLDDPLEDAVPRKVATVVTQIDAALDAARRG